MTLEKILLGIAGVFYALLWIGGVFSYFARGGPPEGAAWAAPAFLAVAALITLALAPPQGRRFVLAAGAVGYLAEIAGVTFGAPFGAYRYTDALGLRWFNVPVVMMAAWIVLTGYIWSFRQRPIVAAFWMTALDLLIDPLGAGPLAFWLWERSGPYYGIPWTNFLGWFVVSVLIFGPAPKPEPEAELRPLRWLGGSIILFFAAIAAGLAMWNLAMVGVWLLAIHFLQQMREKRQFVLRNAANDRA
jgi:uncharacterized membrane protein